MSLIPRVASGLLAELAAGLRIVIVNGPRQCGKTTLLQEYHHIHGGTFSTLDDDGVLATARTDPQTFVRYGERPHLIDEVQRGGDQIVLAIKQVVDTDQARGQFILSGSTRFLLVPTLSESLAGRAGFVDLWPLATAERTGGSASFADRVFNESDGLLGATTPWRRHDYLELMVGGGYPEPIAIESGRARRAWYSGYLATVTSRDIADFAQVHRGRALLQLLRLVAARSGGLAVVSDLARGAGLDREAARNYLRHLEMVFLIHEVPAWSTNLTNKVAKTSKLYLTDSGLAAHLLDVSVDALRRPGHPGLGGLVETFVFTELLKLQTFGDVPFTIRHLRERDGREIDFVLEAADGRVVAIEVKASASANDTDARHLRWLRDRAGDRFVAGLVLYLGDGTYSFGDRITAAPVSALWGHAALP